MGKIVVFQKGSKRGHVWDGDYEAGVTPSNALLIQEVVPDIANKNGGKPTLAIRSIYNESAWKQVVIDGDAPNVEEDTDAK